MKNRLFWKIGLLNLLLIVLVLAAVDSYVVRALQGEFLDAAFAQLDSLMRLALAIPPQSSDESQIKEWTGKFGQSRVRVTLIAETGRVLADSVENSAKMENHLPRPEVREALLKGSGRAVRRSPTLKYDFVYLAKRYQPKNGQLLIVRLSLPLDRLEEAQFAFRARLWGISLLILAIAGGASLLFFRTISGRIGRLKEFSRKVADGDFRPLPMDHNNDELSELSSTLNQTALKLDRTIWTLTEERNQSAAVLASMEKK
jgi:two-component system phosphate regulon sensor histidine kinase PhoR